MMSDEQIVINIPKATFDMIMNYLAERPVKEVFGLVTTLVQIANEQIPVPAPAPAPAPTIEAHAEPQA